LVFTSNRTGWTELFLMALASGAVTQLTRGSADTADPAWSPSGEDIAFVQEVGGCGRLCSLRPAAPEVRVLRETTGWHSRPQWDPGGNALTVEFESATTPPDVYRLQLDGRRTVRETPLTDSRSPAVESSGLVSPELVRYPSLDGTPIVGYLYRPQRASSSSPCPAIVHPHGGPTESWGFLWSLRVQWLVAKGYAVLAPDYRGSTGHGLDFQRALIGQWGVVDTQDILSGADYLGSLGWVDARRLAVFGSSYGCYLAVLALARDPKQRFRCAAGEYGDSDILRSWATGDRPGREDLERQMGRPPGRQEAYRRGSPIHDVSEIHAPLLLAHGLDDERVDPRQSEELVAELQRLGKTFEYVTYAGEGHGLLNPANLRHFYSRLERFLDWHLM
jgi:dipeptidyl aminopeptidase/acylaminoacyl peptidase